MIVDSKAPTEADTSHYQSLRAETSNSLSRSGSPSVAADTLPAASPPSYITALAASPSGLSPGSTRPPCNYLYITQGNKAIKGTWFVDPNLQIPAAMMPVIPDGDRRQNLRIESHNGSVAADITIVGNGPGKAYLDVLSHNGSVRVSVVSHFDKPLSRYICIRCSYHLYPSSTRTTRHSS
jgi:hypothetical protein